MNRHEQLPFHRLMHRREFLSAVALAPVVPHAPLWASRITRSSHPRIEELDFTSLRSPIISQENFYVRDHFPEPHLASQSWQLQVGGHVRSRLEVTYAEILRWPAAGRPRVGLGVLG
jgi:DMSO/TMAO reductase YedYZ molybdopterin-dependent catalytic subunit